MKYYVQLLQRTECKWENGRMVDIPFKEQELAECCGSDAVLILDGRESLLTHIMNGEERRQSLKNVMPYVCGFRIMKGSRFSDKNEIIYEGVDK